jgi:RNA polymerase sigma-70 factor (ECF subfamily)
MLIYLQALSSEQEQQSFEALYLRYRSLMRAVAMKLLNDPQDAEDAVHQAFLSILKHFHKISSVDCPETRAFVVIIVERKALDILRTRKNALPLEEMAHGVEIPLPGDNGLADTLAQLPARYRQVLLLRFAYGYTTRELAKEFGMTQSAVQKLIWRAKETLKNHLSEGGGNDENK